MVRGQANLNLVLFLAVVVHVSCERKSEYEAELVNGADFSSLVPDVESQLMRLETELKETKGLPEWAGEYYWGDGLGANISLIIAPSGFAHVWTGCLGVYGQNFGEVQTQDGKLVLTCRLPNKDKFGETPTYFIPVRWGTRSYLVAADELAEFSNAVNSGSEPRKSLYGSFLLKRGDEGKPVDGWPEIPDSAKEMLLDEPITARILAIGATRTSGDGDTHYREIAVTVDKGRAAGVFVDMELFPIAQNWVLGSIKISEVRENQAVGIITQYGESDAMPRSGLGYSTCAHQD